MAIQPVDLGAPVTGVGGDDYRQAHTKINANFVEVGADIVALKAKDATQDTAINLKAVKTEVTTELGLKANVSDVNAKNTTQDSAINLRATTSSVDAKNATQDAAITAADNLAKAAIPKAEKGAPNGVATLDVDGKISPLQIPTEQPIAWGNITGDIADQSDLGTAATKEVGVGVGQIPLVENIPDLAKTTLTYTETTVELPNLAVDSEGTLKRSTQVLGTAATKNTGLDAGEVLLAENAFKAANSTEFVDDFASTGVDCNDLEFGIRAMVDTDNSTNGPPRDMGLGGATRYWTILTIGSKSSDTTKTGMQIAIGYITNASCYRTYHSAVGAWKEWVSFSSNSSIFTATSTTTPNTVVGADGVLKRSTVVMATAADIANLNSNSISVGAGAPKIAYKKLAGVVSNTIGDTLLAHGLNSLKILDIAVTVGTPLTGQFMVHNFRSTGFLFTQHYNGTHVLIRTFEGESTSLIGQPIKVLITYEV